MMDRLADALKHLDECCRRRGAADEMAAVAAQAHQAALRNFGAQDPRTMQAALNQQGAVAAQGAVQQEERSARAAVTALRASLASADASSDFEALTADVPIALLPVRLETRFSGSDLLIRIYPDEIAIQTHEVPLNSDEAAAGRTYWNSGWDPTKEADAWRVLIAVYGSSRAAWIVRQMMPLNLATRPAGQPQFPTVASRTGAWTAPPRSFVLPDRWVAVGYLGGQEKARATGAQVPDGLACGFDPGIAAGDAAGLVDVSGNGLKLDSEFRWAVDFAEAERVGMGLRMTLADPASGLDRLVVLGVKSSLKPDQAVGRLNTLFDGHHYARGLAFLRQGTPTNNLPGAPSSFTPPDPAGAVSFAVERGQPFANPNGSGRRFTAALGLAPDLTAHIANADLDEQSAARAMNDALWPCTLGYYLAHIMEPVFNDPAILNARSHFIENVRGRGPLPAFRIGGTPYGLLPVSSLDKWSSAAGATPAASQLPTALQTLLPVWLSAAAQAPRIGRTGDSDRDLIETLGMEASTREVYARRTTGPELLLNAFRLAAVDFTPWLAAHNRISQEVLSRVGHPEWKPRGLHLTFQPQRSRIRLPLVQAGPLSEDGGLQPNYITAIRKASVDQLRTMRSPGNALLAQLLRQAALLEYDGIATELGIRASVFNPLVRRAPEIVGIAESNLPTTWARFAAKIPALTGTRTLGEFVLTTPAAASYRDTLAALEGLPSAELERLFTETLDACAHRLDAWVTSLYTQRLAEMRNRTPAGIHLGGFAWAEDVRPAPPDRFRTIGLPDGGTGLVQTSSGGFIQAPTASHASAAALLRNAYISRSGDDPARYAVDLSSARVRTAQFLLDCVREGQTLGAVLGYRLERRLHEGHLPLRLDKYIDPLRRLYPLVANKIASSDEPADLIAARNVVDGLKLARDFRANQVPFGSQGLPSSGDDRAAIEQDLRSLDEDLDAVADLMCAESVYQLVRGNTAASAAALDAVGQGTRPPEPEIAQQPRGGTPLTHRVAILLGGDPLPPGPWASIPATPMAAAEPHVDGWMAALIGNPARVRCRAAYLDPKPNDPGDKTTRVVSLANLQIRPIDLLALAAAPASLDERVAWVVLGDAPAHTQVSIDYSADPTQNPNSVLTFSDVMELVREGQRVLSVSRPLSHVDLLPPEEASAASGANLLDAEATARAAAAVTALTGALSTLNTGIAAIQNSTETLPDLTDLRNALLGAAAFGVAGAVPAARKGSSPELRGATLDQATRARDELSRRLAAASAAVAPEDKAKAVFGGDFPFLRRFVPAAAPELGQALSGSAALTGGLQPVRKWFQQAARVRAPLGRWRKLSLLARSLGAGAMDFEAIQLPNKPGARWAALPFPTENQRPARSLSIVLQRASKPAATDPWVGLMLDEWSEVIPAKVEQTAIAFHYDDPGAEAAQAVLIAVPPAAGHAWSLDAALATLNETIDLMKARAVDTDLLGALGQLLPAIFIAENPAEDVPSVKLSAVVAADAVIKQPE